ncbi:MULTISPECIES: hypothetical protein [Okeania]|nr:MULTISPECIES: hypothetical protein [Okeania]
MHSAKIAKNHSIVLVFIHLDQHHELNHASSEYGQFPALSFSLWV